MLINTGEREIEKRGALKLILARDVSTEEEREGGWVYIPVMVLVSFAGKEKRTREEEEQELYKGLATCWRELYMFFLIILPLSLPLSLARCSFLNAIPPLAHSSPYCIAFSIFSPSLFLLLLPPFPSSAEATRRACRDSQAGFLLLPSSSSLSSFLLKPLVIASLGECRATRRPPSPPPIKTGSTAIEYKSVVKS